MSVMAKNLCHEFVKQSGLLTDTVLIKLVSKCCSHPPSVHQVDIMSTPSRWHDKCGKVVDNLIIIEFNIHLCAQSNMISPTLTMVSPIVSLWCTEHQSIVLMMSPMYRAPSSVLRVSPWYTQGIPLVYSGYPRVFSRRSTSGGILNNRLLFPCYVLKFLQGRHDLDGGDKVVIGGTPSPPLGRTLVSPWCTGDILPLY